MKIDYAIREKCVINGSELEILSSKLFPLFCGCVDTPQEEDLICEQEFAISKEGVIQLTKLIPLDLLYANGHDAGSVGALWEEHHTEFAKFILSKEVKNVLEIGGGHGKLSQNCLAIKKIRWTIVEPNPTHRYDNVVYVDNFFSKELFQNEKFDTVVHSHTFEHIYNPHHFLQEVSSVLVEGGGGKMLFSLPNMQKGRESKFTNGLNFEHTILLSEAVLEFLFAKHQFRLIDKHYFKDHSIFYYLQKDSTIQEITLKNEYHKNKKMFLDLYEYYEKQIAYLNNILRKSTKEIYLFGAHLFGQFLIFNGLDISRISCILDNNPAKQGRRLYGTSLFVKSPKILKDKKDALVILNAGIYNDEIKKDIIENINDKVEIINF